MKRKVKTYDIKLPIWTIVDVTFIKVYTQVHIFGTYPSFCDSAWFWIAHVYVHTTLVPFLKISTEAAPNIQDILTLFGYSLDERPLGIVMILSNLLHDYT